MFDFSGLIAVNTCSSCSTDADCQGLDVCAKIFDFQTWQGSAQCVPPGSVMQDDYCDLEGSGDQACGTGICSVVDVQGLDEFGACGQCNTDADCGVGGCTPGNFSINDGTLTGSTCQ
jgi:hypothetical protein